MERSGNCGKDTVRTIRLRYPRRILPSKSIKVQSAPGFTWEGAAMSQLENGWPLGLQPLNSRVGLVRNHDRNGSISFSTLLTGSPCSSIGSSSDLDTESTSSFLRDKSITLGSLIGVSSILELSRRSMRGRPAESSREKKTNKPKPWFSLCSKLSTDAVNMNENTQSLAHFLQAERQRRAANSNNPR